MGTYLCMPVAFCCVVDMSLRNEMMAGGMFTLVIIRECVGSREIERMTGEGSCPPSMPRHLSSVHDVGMGACNRRDAGP
jgi:hypothetical protein